jgi:hypothetical protein
VVDDEVEGEEEEEDVLDDWLSFSLASFSFASFSLASFSLASLACCCFLPKRKHRKK